MICVRYVEKAKKIAKKKGIAFTHISTELGKSRGYLSEMLASERDLSENMLADVASLLGVTVADLTGDFENEKKLTAQGDGLSEFTEKEAAILKWFRSLPEEKRRAILIAQDAPKELLD